ncbi:NepR family anti-sigma factor [Sphingomonas naphthae]|uniref:NepR family anti-sigma factor n=1 Tax=Sphingomonas naphthae TaxID=1813468 RepID=A0ABY7TMB1_9SPHN|nr:NepR family anti-sigma factor [Sphingomonas naphthae]WCT73379.1 NepR family anti-sigma factor [Sphingomonas naphthae]
MASRNDDDEAKRPALDSKDGSGAARKATRKRSENHVGNALRSAYDEAVREDVPDEFLDLLRKLS